MLDGDGDLIGLDPLCVAQVSLKETNRLNELVLDIYDISTISQTLPKFPHSRTTSWTCSPLGPSAVSHWVPLIQDIQALAKCCRSTLNWTDNEILKNFDEQKVYPGTVIQILCSKEVYYDYRDGSLLAARPTQKIANQTTLLNPKPVLPIRVLDPRNFDPRETVPTTFSTSYFIQDVLLALGRPSSKTVNGSDNAIHLHIPVVLLLAATNPSRYGRLIDQPSPPISRKFYLIGGAPSIIDINRED
ncbi:hypothetical protein E1B28_013129 [Marasmius oreades]|uniref:Uncharacterized protein n=1 Tax=Marasmius oreades TaxID=181124 RepID=A0A9P7RNZ0_9AGAR|nr:uncharacterized protein E1B28_013129 [Marasmius oreades]KAG7087149.1 hypothetical protein E1B28_013129 [Marasmius oreades]